MSEAQIDILDSTDEADHISRPASAVVSNVGQSMASRQDQDNVPMNRADDGMVSMIERIVMNPEIPIDRLEQMLALKERMEDRAREDGERRARQGYYAAMAKCQAELPVVTKNRKNDHTKSNYADLAAIEQQAMPIIHKYGFATMFQPAGYNEQGELQIKWKITHESGHAESDIAGIPVDGAGSQGKVNKTGTQAFGSTATYGRRYLLCMLFNITTGDDTDGNRVREDDIKTITPEQVKVILALLDETDSDTEKFCQLGRIDAVPDMLAKDFESAVALLNQKKAKMAQKVAS
jgi:hypothetical protein